MTFIEELFESGGNFIAERTDGGASLTPASDRNADLVSFQHLVRKVREHAGEGYHIHLEHFSADHPGELVDLLLLAID